MASVGRLDRLSSVNHGDIAGADRSTFPAASVDEQDEQTTIGTRHYLQCHFPSPNVHGACGGIITW